MSPDELHVRDEVLGLIPRETCVRHTLVPLDLVGRDLFVAITNPANLFALDDVKFMTGYNVVPRLASEEAILAVIRRMPGSDTTDLPDGRGSFDHATGEHASEAAGAIDATLTGAIECDATHVHLDASPAGYRVSYRVDGIMTAGPRYPPELSDGIAARLKIMSALDIAEKRLPQDGRFTIRLPDGRSRKFWTWTLPTLDGERFLVATVAPLRQIAIENLGFSSSTLGRLKRAIERPLGLVLIAGAPRSGKTTTLYACLDHLNTGTRCILTAEVSIEAPLDNVSRVRVTPSVGLTYAGAVGSIARQDPDVIGVGAIANQDTVETVLRVASTGCAIVGVIDADDASQALLKMLTLGGSAVQVGATVRCVVAQRLARRPGGTGRMAIAETLTPSSGVQAALGNGVTHEELRRIAIEDGSLMVETVTE